MQQSQNTRPTDAELEILQVLWKHGTATVRFVNDTLNATRKVGYTSTLKVMQIMHEKGFLDREEQGRSHLYRALIKEQAAQKLLLDRMVDTAFGGSAMKLVMQALGGEKTSREELAQIRDYLDRLEGGQK